MKIGAGENEFTAKQQQKEFWEDSLSSLGVHCQYPGVMQVMVQFSIFFVMCMLFMLACTCV